MVPEAPKRMPVTARKTFYNAKSANKSRQQSNVKRQRHASRTKKSGAEILHANEHSYRGFPAIHVEA